MTLMTEKRRAPITSEPFWKKDTFYPRQWTQSQLAPRQNTSSTTRLRQSCGFSKKQSAQESQLRLSKRNSLANSLKDGEPQDKPETSSPSDEPIKVLVRDEHLGLRKRFSFTQAQLSRMKFFDSYFQTNEVAHHDVEITVHCDLRVFEWIASYVKGGTRQSLDSNWVISILVAAHFLQMEDLIEDCLSFSLDNIESVLSIPIDFASLDDGIVSLLADKMDADQLYRLEHADAKIASAIYKKKVERELSSNEFSCCEHCGVIYMKRHQSRLDCTSSPSYVDFRGKATRRHQPLSEWDWSSSAQLVRKQGYNWEDIYWQSWLAKSTFHCTTCGLAFTGVEMATCAFHPISYSKPSSSNPSTATTHHDCCNESIFPNILTSDSTGCQLRSHTVAEDGMNRNQLKTLLRCCDKIVSATEIQFMLLQRRKKDHQSKPSQAGRRSNARDDRVFQHILRTVVPTKPRTREAYSHHLVIQLEDDQERMIELSQLIKQRGSRRSATTST